MRTTKKSDGAGSRGYDPKKPFNEEVKALITSTHSPTGPMPIVPFGKRFVIEKDGLSIAFAADGIGTKGAVEWLRGKEANGAQDAFEMVVGDLIEGGHSPFLMLDHIQQQEENKARTLRIVRKLTQLCRKYPWTDNSGVKYPIALIGGETAIINTLEGFEVGIMGIGQVKIADRIFANLERGDIVIGLESSGLHSNGYTFLREGFFEDRKLPMEFILPWHKTLGHELTIPTRVYLGMLQDLHRNASYITGGRSSKLIHGMVHITGGGFFKLRELLPKVNPNVSIRVDAHRLPPQKIFRYIQKEFHVSSEKMYTRFNNGVGYAVVVRRDYEKPALKLLRRHTKAERIGEVVEGDGKVYVESAYGSAPVTY